MDFYTPEEAKNFTDLWLPAWTGNQPKKLISFYAEDAFYLDPAVPQGIHGKENLLLYFEKLLSKYPDWVWTHQGSIPLQDGFVNKWKAQIGRKTCFGVCTVQLKKNLIYRNEVYFDRSLLL